MTITIRPRWRKVLADLWDNKLRTLLVVFSIAIGVFSVGMIAGAYLTIESDMSTSYAAANPYNIELITDPFDEELLDTIRNVAGVAAAEGRRTVSLRVKTSATQWTSLDLIAISDYEEVEINLIRPVAGAPVPADREVLIERKSLEDIPAQPGDELIFQLSDDTLRQMRVAGIVLDQTTTAGDFLSPPLGYITFDTLEWLHQPASFNRLLLTVSENQNDLAHIYRIASVVTDKLEKSGRSVYMTRTSKTNEHPLASIVQAILGVLGALGVLIVLLSSSLIANTLNALLNQQFRQIGVMKLVGARSRQIFSMYMVLILVFGLVALLIAIPTGGRAAFALSELIADELNFQLQGYRVFPLAILLQVFIALLVPLAAGFGPVNDGSRISVQNAIGGEMFAGKRSKPNTEPAQQTETGGLRLQIRQRILHLPRPLLLSLRNTFRRKGRLLLTLATLTMGGAIFIAVFNVRDSLHNYIDQIAKYFIADVTLSCDRSYRMSEIEAHALSIPEVVEIEGWAFTSAAILGPNGETVENMQILAPPGESTLVEPMMISGRWVMPGDENALTVSEDLFKTFPDLKPGDTLRLNINGQEQDWHVVGIFKFVTSERLIGYANYEYVTTLLNLPGRSFSYRIQTERHDPEYQKHMGQVIDEYFRARGFRVQQVESGISTLDAASEGLNVLVTFLLIMALLTASVGSIGLAGTMGMNVMERTREIGIMRSIGAVDWEISKSVIVEGLTIGLISWVLASLLAFPISYMLSTIISLAIFSTPIPLTFSFLGFTIWLVLVLVLSVLASMLPARNAARLTIREVLAYE